MANRFDDLFCSEEDKAKIKVSLTFDHYDRKATLDAEYDEATEWHEVLSDMIALIESQYGYSFDIEGLGIYYKGKKDGN